MEIVESYLQGDMGRFEEVLDTAKINSPKKNADGYYRIPHPGLHRTNTRMMRNSFPKMVEDSGPQPKTYDSTTS